MATGSRSKPLFKMPGVMAAMVVKLRAHVIQTHSAPVQAQEESCTQWMERKEKTGKETEDKFTIVLNMLM